MTKTEIRVPASTSNLGASFDTCGLAVGLYLKVVVEPRDGGLEVALSGEVEGRVSTGGDNLVLRVARHVARQRNKSLPGARILIDSEIPLARGLGSSSSAIIAGISVYEVLTGDILELDELFSYALEFEGHGDNLAPSTLGGMVVTCVIKKDERNSLLTIKREWPPEIKLVLAIPDFEMDTVEMRRALPASVSLEDAVFNLQRGALLQAAISEKRLDLLSEALRDRLHQPYRLPLVRGLSKVLEMNNEPDRLPGLLGVALSGAGSTMAAFVTGGFDVIAKEMVRRLNEDGVNARTIQVDIDNLGRVVRQL